MQHEAKTKSHDGGWNKARSNSPVACAGETGPIYRARTGAYRTELRLRTERDFLRRNEATSSK